eukprot:scaffold1558_cov403-Prasinococcus_capsulatus_cf.AAC.12
MEHRLVNLGVEGSGHHAMMTLLAPNGGAKASSAQRKLSLRQFLCFRYPGAARKQFDKDPNLAFDPVEIANSRIPNVEVQFGLSRQPRGRRPVRRPGHTIYESLPLVAEGRGV